MPAPKFWVKSERSNMRSSLAGLTKVILFLRSHLMRLILYDFANRFNEFVIKEDYMHRHNDFEFQLSQFKVWIMYFNASEFACIMRKKEFIYKVAHIQWDPNAHVLIAKKVETSTWHVLWHALSDNKIMYPDSSLNSLRIIKWKKHLII